MKAKVTKAFKWSPDGNRVVDVEPGSVVEGECAKVATANGWGEEQAEAAPPPPPPPPHAPPPVPEEEDAHAEKSLDEAPHNKALHRSPYHKRK